jgi:hypothetical protein
MLNIRSIPTRGVGIDRVIACATERAGLTDSSSTTSKEDSMSCATLTNAVFLLEIPQEEGPGAVIILPIYPEPDPDVVRTLEGRAIFIDDK